MKIQTYDDLLAEKAALEDRLLIQRGLIQNDWREIKEELHPVTTVLGFIGRFMNGPTTGTIAKFGAGVATDFLINKIFLRNTGWMLKLALPFVIKKLSPLKSVLGLNGHGGSNGNFFHRLSDKWKK